MGIGEGPGGPCFVSKNSLHLLSILGLPNDYLIRDRYSVTGNKEDLMKYICLGYLEPGTFENMSESERNSVFDECFSYNDELRKKGHLIDQQALQPANTAVTVSWRNGKVAFTDGPYAETKEQLGGLQVLEARDLNHAIQLISQSPGVRLGCGLIEIRPAADINEMIKASERRRQNAAR
jgi:hypothetical protein